MPVFLYEALNDAGTPQKGTVKANNSEDAIARIRSMNLFPTSVRESKNKDTIEKAEKGEEFDPVVFELKKSNWINFVIGLMIMGGLFFLLGFCVGGGFNV